jgi:hypothetical protein
MSEANTEARLAALETEVSDLHRQVADLREALRATTHNAMLRWAAGGAPAPKTAPAPTPTSSSSEVAELRSAVRALVLLVSKAMSRLPKAA